MSKVLTGDKLINSVRTRAMVPNDTSVYDDQDILDVANEEMSTQLLDKLLALHEEHLITSVDIPKNNQGTFEIPTRAIGNKLRDASLLRGADGTPYELHRVNIGELPDLTFGKNGAGRDLFYLEGNQVKLISPNTSYESIRMYYYLSPSTLTKIERAGVITNFSQNEVTGTVTFTFSKMPKNIKLSDSNGIPNKFDIVSSSTPNKIISIDLDASSINESLKTITLDNSDNQINVSEIKLGDYVTLAEESPVPNVPTEMHPYLAQLTAIHILEAMGDTEGLSNAMRRLDKMEKSVMQLVDDRVELAPMKIKSRHGTVNEGIQNRRYYRNKRR